jgi:hypothetical protein
MQIVLNPVPTFFKENRLTTLYHVFQGKLLLEKCMAW